MISERSVGVITAGPHDMAIPSKGDEDTSFTVSVKDDIGRTVRGKLWSRQEKKQWSIALFMGCSALYACRTVMPLCVMAISKELEWDKTESGTILSSFFWGYTLTQFLGGYLSDQIGGDVILPIAATFWSLLTFWTPVLATLVADKHMAITILVISRVLLGMCQGFHYPGFTSIIAKKVSEKERSFTYAFTAAGSHLGTLMCGSLGSLLLERYGWQSAFYACGVGGLAWMLFVRYYLIGKYRQKYVPDMDSMIVAEKLATKPKEKTTSVPWLVLFATPAFWSLLVGHFCQSNAFYILLSWLPSYFHENYPSAKGWVFNVVPWLVSIPSSIFSGWFADHLISKGYSVTLVRKLMASVNLAGVAFFLILLTYTSTYPWSLFCMAMCICCSGFHNSGIAVNPQDLAPNCAGSVFGIMNMAGAIPGFVGVYMAGHILEATHSWNAVFNQTAMVCLFGWIVFSLFGTGKKII